MQRRATDKDFRGPTSVQTSQRQQVRNLGGKDFNSASHRPLNGRGSQLSTRKVTATANVSGMDVSQKYDAFNHGAVPEEQSPWHGFFGAPPHPYKSASYEKYDRHNYNLPEAYIGQNLQLAQTIDELIYTEETFYTTELLPYYFTDQLSIAWDKWEFNEHFTGIVPEQGVSRLVTSHRTSRSEGFVRHGLAAVFEHGFMETEEGRANYYLTLAQIARAVQETTNFGVIYAFLTCQNYAKQWEEKHGYFRNRTLKDLLAREHFMWAITIKVEFGMEKLDASIVEWMNNYRASADTWILPPKPAMYLRLVPEEKTYYYKAGPEGPNRVNNIVGAGRPHEANAKSKRIHDIVEPYAVFKKNNVFLTRTYHIERTGPIDLMTRISSVGEYFKLVKGSATHDYRNGYNPQESDLRIYNEDDDCGHTVSKIDAIRYSQVFDETGAPRVPVRNISPEDAADLDSVFFLRSVLDPVTQQNTYLPIEWCGDIDPAFMSPTDVQNLAHAAVASAIPDMDTRRKIEQDVRNGVALINRLSVTAISENQPAADSNLAGLTVENLGGWTTFDAMRRLAGSQNALAPIAANLISAVQMVATAIGTLFGGTENVFLNPANALPFAEYEKATPERVLYENFINYNSVPVFTLGDGDVQEDTRMFRNGEPGIQQAYASLLSAFLDADVPAEARLIQQRNLNVETVRADRARYVSLPATRENYNSLRSFLLANGLKTKTKAGSNGTVNQRELNQYVASVDTVLADASARAPAAAARGRVVRREGTPSPYLAVSRNNPTFADEDRGHSKGLALASRFDVTVPGDEYETQYDTNSAAGDFTVSRRPVLMGTKLEDLPLMRGIAAAQSTGQNVGTNYKVASASQGGRRSHQQFMGADAPLDSYYDDAEPIGSMIGHDGPDVARLRETILNNRVWMPEAGAQLSAQPVNLRFGTMAKNLELLSKSSMDPLAKLVSSVYLGAPWRESTLTGFEQARIPAPVGIIGFRVGRYNMALGIKCKAGGDTGYTYFGHSDFMLADDAAIKIHYGNYTHYGKSVIHKEENVFVAYDIFPNECLGGMGIRPYLTPDQFQPEDDIRLGDIFYVMVPYTETNFPVVMSMAGRFYTYMDAGMLDADDPANRELHYSTAAYYNRIWGWHSESEVVIELDDPLYRKASSMFRTDVWQGAQGSYNTDSKKFDRDIIRNKSPWGVTAEGCKASRDGRMEKVPQVIHGVLGF